jgi:peptidyl-dipeptidase A
MIESDARAFVERMTARIHPVLTQYSQAQWDLATTGAPDQRAALEQLGAAYTRLSTSDPAEWAAIQRMYASRAELGDTPLRREVELLYNSFAAAQVAPEQIDRLAALEAGLTDLYTNFRGTVDGRPVAENQIRTVLRDETDSELRREAWEASKQIGAAARDGLLELVELRNQSARTLGFRDYYAQSLALQEIDEDELFALLDDLELRTREPFRLLKAELDTALAARLRVPLSELRPWHYSDPFFQEAPRTGAVDLDALYADQDVIELATRTFDGLGLEVRDVLARSDLFERENKDQHAFCTHIDRLSDDVRVLCNVRPDARWMGTLLHELGHAIYDKYLAADLPFLLRTAAHTNTTEAIAMLMGRLATDPEWLARVRGLAGDDEQALVVAARAEERTGQLVFLRWGLVMAYFERALYANPRRADLNTLWWDLVERFQLVARPDGRDEPDWAAKIHLAIAPVYYHNYVLGELTASQLSHALATQSADRRLVSSPAAGAFLRERLFALGARYPWNETLQRVTGERLNSRYYVEEFVEQSAQLRASSA